MKTYILTLLLLCVSCLSSAQGDDLFREFKKEPCAEYVMIPSYVMAIGKMFMNDDPDARMAKKVKTIRVLDMERCPKDVRRRFERRVNALRRKSYEPMIRVNEDGEQAHIYIRIKDDLVRELLIACSEADECTLVQIKGKFTKEDMTQLIDDQLSHKDER